MKSLSVFHLPDLLYRIAHSYKGGIPALAARMDKSSNVLNKKVNPSIDTHHTTLDDLLTILDFADDEKLFTHALCANQGGVFVSTANFEGISDMDLLETFTNLMAANGQFSVDFNNALSDRRISKEEVQRIKQDAYAISAAAAALVSRLETLVDD
jgi:hypothetical protein